MPFYAQLNSDGIVTAITETADIVTAPDMIELPAMDASLLGQRYESGQFVPVPAPTLPRIITKVAMLTHRLKQAEFVGILQASKTDVAIEAWKYVFDAASQIDLDAQNTKDGMALLVAKNLLTQERADEILGAEVQPHERP